MTQNERLDFLINHLISEDNRYSNIVIPKNSEEKFNLFRSLVNVREPKQISNEFIKLQDDYLQERLTEINITDAYDLQAISNKLYLWQGDITTLKCGAIVNAAKARTDLAVSDSFVRGILCNILVCIAIWMSFAAKRVSGKLMTSFWPVMIFVLCGFEHCIADMYFGVAGLLTASEYGITADGLTWFNFIVKNLLVVTIGNIIGGCATGIAYWFSYYRKQD